MSKKKRNKPYKGGKTSTNARPTITRVSAVNRHPVHQWWLDHKIMAKPALIISGIAIVVVLIIIGIIGLIW